MSRLAAALVVGAVILGGALSGSAPASAETDAPADSEGAVTLEFTTASGATIAPGGSLLGTVTIDNGTEAELSAGTVVLELNGTALTDGEDLESWLDTGTAGGQFRTVATEPSAVVESGSGLRTDLIADAADLGTLAPGVYPLRARLRDATAEDDSGAPVAQEPVATTVLVVTDTERRSGVLVPITATPADGALLTADELVELTAADGALTGQLDAVTGTTAVLAVDPAIVTSIRMLGTRAPASATAWLTRLEALPNDIFALQFADADPAAQVHGGLTTLLAPPDLAPLLQQGDFPASTPSPSPSPAPSATAAPTVPGNAELSAISGAQGGILWPRGDLTDADVSRFAAQLGAQAMTIAPSTSVDRTGVAHGTVGGHDVLVTDAAASSRLSAAVEAADEGTRQRELAATAGHLFYAQQSSALVLLGLERSETRSPVALREALTAFASPDVRLLTALSETAIPVKLTGTPDAARAVALQTMLEDEQRITTFSAILDEPAVLLIPERIRLLRTIGVGLDDDEFEAARTRRGEQVSATLGAVSIQQPQPVQLFTSAAPLPVWVRNELPWPVNVSLSSDPSSPRLDVQPVTPVTAGAAGSTRVNIPIEARVASGDVRVAFRLFGPNGAAIGEPAVADVTLRADWEGIGLVILGGVIGLLLVFGILRTILRRRRADAATRAEVRAETDAAAR